jgi:DNA-binding NarL/FixJ family response regulator
MSLLRRLLRYITGEPPGAEETRIFLRDEELVSAVRDVAMQQRRTEEDVIADLTKVGLNQFLSQNEMEKRWASLSHREQQVVALLCLGYRNHEIAETLVIAPETVKTHLQRVFDKFDLRSRKELRLALKNWDFREWWQHNNDQQE